MKKIFSFLCICALLILSPLLHAQTNKDAQKEKEETVNWILQKLNANVITNYKMTSCEKAHDIFVESHDNFTYDYSENCFIWTSDEVSSEDNNVHKISSRKFFIKYYSSINSSDELTENVTFNSKCAQKHNPKMIHILATGKFVEINSFYYRRQYSNQYDKAMPKTNKFDINFKYAAENNLVVRLDKALTHLKDLVAPVVTTTEHKEEKF